MKKMGPWILLAHLLPQVRFLDNIPYRLGLLLVADTLDNATCQEGNLQEEVAGNPCANLVMYSHKRDELKSREK